MIISFSQTVTDDVKTRRRRIQHFCRNSNYESLFSHIEARRVLLYNRSVAFCRANKCATTFTVMTLKNLFGCSEKNPCNSGDITTKYGLSSRELVRNLDDKYSFFFVREPYRRLFSTYSNKFYLPKEHWAPIGPTIAKYYRENPSPDSLEFGHDVTFKELIQYTVDMYEQGISLDQHLAPMHELCNPCRHDYNYIGRLESLNYDWDKIISDWKKQGLVNLTITKSEIFPQKGFSEVGHSFKTIEMTQRSSITRFSLFQRTWSYYQIVGRISKQIQMPFTEDEVDHVKRDQYITAIKKAIKQSEEFGKNVVLQRTEALLQAYSTVPIDLLERLRNVVLVDCFMFGYDDRPDWLFDRSKYPSVTDYNYFISI